MYEIRKSISFLGRVDVPHYKCLYPEYHSFIRFKMMIFVMKKSPMRIMHDLDKDRDMDFMFYGRFSRHGLYCGIGVQLSIAIVDSE